MICTEKRPSLLVFLPQEMVFYLLTDERLFVMITLFFRKENTLEAELADVEYSGIDTPYRYSIDKDRAIELAAALKNPFAFYYDKSFPEIERLNIESVDKETIKKILPAFPNLKELKLHSGKFSDLSFLSVVPDLESLIIEYWDDKITEFIDLSGIETCKKIKHIFFFHVRAQELKNTELLNSLPEFTCLQIRWSDFDLKFVRELTNLKELYLQGIHLKIYTLKNLDTLTELKVLQVTDVYGLYTKFKKLKSLEYLFVGMFSVYSYETKIGFKGIDNLKNLKLWEINERDIANPHEAEKYKNIINNDDIEWPKVGQA